MSKLSVQREILVWYALPLISPIALAVILALLQMVSIDDAVIIAMMALPVIVIIRATRNRYLQHHAHDTMRNQYYRTIQQDH